MTLGKLVGLDPSSIADAISDVVGKVDGLVTNAEERATIRMALYSLQAQTTTALAEARIKIMQAQADVIKTEITAEDPIQRKWRPWLMLTFGAVVVYSIVLRDMIMWLFAAFGQAVPELPAVGSDVPDGMWLLLQLGIGGYIGGRTIEKVASSVKWSNVVDAADGLFDKKRKRD